MYILYKDRMEVMRGAHFYPIGMKLMREFNIRLKNGFVNVKEIINKAEDNGYKIKRI